MNKQIFKNAKVEVTKQKQDGTLEYVLHYKGEVQSKISITSDEVLFSVVYSTGDLNLMHTCNVNLLEKVVSFNDRKYQLLYPDYCAYYQHVNDRTVELIFKAKKDGLITPVVTCVCTLGNDGKVSSVQVYENKNLHPSSDEAMTIGSAKWLNVEGK